jgi:hypothetical protein
MDALANFFSALLHHGDQNARLIPFVENITKTLAAEEFHPRVPRFQAALWRILITQNKAHLGGRNGPHAGTD